MFSLGKKDTAFVTELFLHNSAGAAVTGEAANLSGLLTVDGAVSAVAVTITEINSGTRPGRYKVTFTPNAVGMWFLRVVHATHAPVGFFEEVLVFTRSLEDLAFPATSGRALNVNGSGAADASVTFWQGGAVASLVGAFGAPSVNLEAWRGTAPNTLTSGRVEALVGAVGANAITGDGLAASVGAEIADAVWDEDLAGHVAAGSAGEAQGRLDAAVSTRLAPTTAGRTLDVSAGGEAGVDWGNVGSPSAVNNLSNTAVGSVNGNVSGSVGSVAAGGITAASIASDAIDADALANSAITELAANLPSNASIADAVWDEARSGHTTAGTFGEGVASVIGNVGGNVVGSVASVVGNVGGNVLGSVASLATGAVVAASFTAGALQAIADELLDRASAVDGYTPRQVLKIIGAAVAGKGKGTVADPYRALNDSADRIGATTTPDGDRQAVTLNV